MELTTDQLSEIAAEFTIRQSTSSLTNQTNRVEYMSRLPGPIARQAAARAKAAEKTSDEMIAIRAARAAEKERIDTAKAKDEITRKAEQRAADLIRSEGMFRSNAHPSGPWLFVMHTLDAIRSKVDGLETELAAIKSEAKPVRKAKTEVSA